MTIQQLAGTSSKGSNGIVAMLGVDENAGQAPHAGFSAALHRSMTQGDNGDSAGTVGPDEALSTSGTPTNRETTAEPAPGSTAHGEITARTDVPVPGYTAAQPAASQQPQQDTHSNIQRNIQRDTHPNGTPWDTHSKESQSSLQPELLGGQSALDLDIHHAQQQQMQQWDTHLVTITPPPGATLPAITEAHPEIERSENSETADETVGVIPAPPQMFTAIELPSALTNPHAAGSAFTRGLPWLIDILRDATSATEATQTETSETSFSPQPGAAVTLSGLSAMRPQHDSILSAGTPAPPHIGMHASARTTSATADGLLAQFADAAPDSALAESAAGRPGPESTSAPAPQIQVLSALLGSPPNARDMRSLTPDTAASSTAQFPASTTMGSDAWLRDLGTRMEWLQEMKLSKAELFLHPEELGALEISIVSENDTTSVAFVTQTAAAREIIESTLPRLRELLASQGLQLEQSNVSQQSADGHKRGQAPGELRNTLTAATEPAAESEIVRRGSRTLPSGQIDHYV